MLVTKEELESLEYISDEIEYDVMDYRDPRDLIDNYKSLSDEQQKLVFSLILMLLSS